jgi:ketol-acid reductoisomerase
MVLNLTPDKQHSAVVSQVMPLMKQGACLSYSHGFNIVEEGMQIREDLTVIMVAPKCPGTEVREEYKRGFGVPTLIAVHTENDPQGQGLELAKAYAVGTGGHRAGVLESSFIAEVKSDLMGEQTILCGMLQTGSILCFDKMVASGIEPGYASKHPIWLGNCHRRAETGRYHQHDGSFIKPGQSPSVLSCGGAQKHHAATVRETPRRHHYW